MTEPIEKAISQCKLAIMEYRDEIEQRNVKRLAVMEARLAAVVERVERWMDEFQCDHRGCHLDHPPCPACALESALARGEGGEQGSSRHEPCEADAADREEAGDLAAPDAHGNASRNDVTKPQQSPASDRDWWCPTCKERVPGSHVTYQECHEDCGTYLADCQPPDVGVGGLDEIVRDAIERYREFQPDMKERRFQEIAYMVARRARETDPTLAATQGERNILFGRVEAYDSMISEAREQLRRVADHIHEPCETALQLQLFDILAILDGKEADHE